MVAEAKAALQQGMCVVIGLQSTGEAAADAIGLEPGPVPGFVSTTKELLYRLVEGHYPTREERVDEHGGWGGRGAAGVRGPCWTSCCPLLRWAASMVRAA